MSIIWLRGLLAQPVAASATSMELTRVISSISEILPTICRGLLETAAAMLGNGKLGSVLQNALKLEIRMKDGESKKISDAIAESFPKLSKALGDALAGAQMGEQIGGFMKALGIKTSKTGSQIGGAFGQMFGGPLGAIAGSIAGGLIGGMMKSTPRASATIETISGNAISARTTRISK